MDLVCLQQFSWGLVLGRKCKEVQDGNWFKALVRKQRVVLSKAELLNILYLAGVLIWSTTQRRQAERGASCCDLASMWPSHLGSSSGLERRKSAQSHLLAWRADFHAGEILPNQLSIGRALVISHGAAVSSHTLPSAPLGLSQLLSQPQGLLSGEPVGWDGNGDNYLPVVNLLQEINLVRLSPCWRIP